MCGIVGFLVQNYKYAQEHKKNIIAAMAETLSHRGPDDLGIWFDPEGTITFGHRRLSIIDLSPEGHQPMVSASSRYVITFNGEIYNFQQIRKDLEKRGFSFRGHSDTEILVSAIEEWGLEKALEIAIGMFAFALWDRKERKLYLVRDRLGEKPLYYGWMGQTFLFASELKALNAHPDFVKEINRDILALYLRYNYIPTPYSIYKDIFKLPPGHFLVIDDNQQSQPKPMPYWSADKVIQSAKENPYMGTEEEAIGELDNLLKDVVKKQMISDVPLGAFLSGGIDSSTIVALMQSQSSNRVRTFTIGFNEEKYNEAHDAKRIANYLGTDHTELYVQPYEAMEVIPKLANLYDEPFADSSQIPTLLVAQLTRTKVTVSLSGDGGDEIFGGYNRHYWANNIWQKINKMPLFLRNNISNLLTDVPPKAWDNVYEHLNKVLPAKYRLRLPGNKIHKLAGILNVDSPYSMYKNLVSSWKNPSSVVIGSNEPNQNNSQLPKLNFSETMMYLDLLTYLPDDILVKVDRACMGVSLESRVPYLDHRVVEFGWRLPLSMKIKNGQGKWILRQLLYRYIPSELINSPKMGFGVPIDSWLRGPLKSWAEDLLSPEKVRREGYFAPEPIWDKWNEHISGKYDWHHELWSILIFEMWLQEQYSR
ncbi:MAG: asparagine synthase (glutamine-hydrolyzing) [Bacillota bacterium]